MEFPGIGLTLSLRFVSHDTRDSKSLADLNEDSAADSCVDLFPKFKKYNIKHYYISYNTSSLYIDLKITIIRHIC